MINLSQCREFGNGKCNGEIHSPHGLCHNHYMKYFYKFLETPESRERRRQKAKQYRQQSGFSQKRKQWDKKYITLHPDKRKESANKYVETHREQKRVYDNNYIRKKYRANREAILEARRQWRINNPEKARAYDKLQRERHPDKVLARALRQMTKLAKKAEMSAIAYRNAQISWAKAIKQRAEKQCEVCGKPAVHAHHVFYKSKYPELQFNINNGVALCKEHHLEVHRLNKTRRVKA